MAFLLTELLAGSTDVSSMEAVSVAGVNADSRAIARGEVFFALPGTTTHGDAFCAQAVERGAVAVVSDRPVMPHPGVSVFVVDDVRAAYARAAARAMAPQPRVHVAVTGTNGKTSVASFLRQIWQASGLKAASVGTLGIDTGSGLLSGSLTTPDSLTLHKNLAVLKAQDIDHIVLEASSHGLDQRRLDGISFNAVGFTNLTRDHLDYHATMDDYREAKLRLFRELLAENGSAVVNTDDPEHMPFMFAALDKGATLMTVGEEGAHLEVQKVTREGFGQRVEGRLVGEPISFHLPLTGRFQVDNAVMAAALAIATGIEPPQVVGALSRLKGARGRMEKAGEKNGGAIFVDYSHTPDALKNALLSLRPYAAGRLIVVFGCGGDRDRGKRPEMGAIAHELADLVYVTDDNPRGEEAWSIRSAILAAAPDAVEIGDRAEAIRAAIGEMREHDVVLIAGKGHEDYQIIGTTKHHFSDYDVVKEALFFHEKA